MPVSWLRACISSIFRLRSASWLWSAAESAAMPTISVTVPMLPAVTPATEPVADVFLLCWFTVVLAASSMSAELDSTSAPVDTSPATVLAFPAIRLVFAAPDSATSP